MIAGHIANTQKSDEVKELSVSGSYVLRTPWAGATGRYF